MKKPQPEQLAAHLTASLLTADAAIRAAVRTAKHQPRTGGLTPPVATPGAKSGGPRITVSVYEARALLRAALPAPLPPFRGRARQQHAELVTALALFTSHLAALASGDSSRAYQAQRQCLGSALALSDALRSWLTEMRWREATKAAKMRWPRTSPQPRAVPIRAVTRQQAALSLEHGKNTDNQAHRIA